MSDGFFSSRFVLKPSHVVEIAGMPAGFRLAGISCGVKQPDSGGLDLGIVVSDAAGTVSAARFCDSGVLAAPVVVTRERADLHAIRAVVANSGNANAATGEAGIAEAVRVQEAAAAALGLSSREVAVASTGVIGVLLPGERIAAAVPRLAEALTPGGLDDFAEAIKHDGRARQARQARGCAAVGQGPSCGSLQGRGDDLPALRDDAVLRADRRRADRPIGRRAARRGGAPLVRPRQRRRPALHQ